jgi:bifunctional non-homologous end joining protein LigD
MDGFSIDITNPDKLLIASAGFTKSDFVEYYLSIEKPLMASGKGRPLSMKRYPDGVPGLSFFQRNKPSWAPAWIKSQLLGVDKKADYVVLENIKIIIWLLNLDTVEFHAAQVAAPHFENPNMLIFDLDPPAGSSFAVVRDFALAIRPEIESFGYKTFVKTSGKKGIHIHCPILPNRTFDEVFAAAKEIGAHINGRYKGCTLSLKKRIGPIKS